MLDCVVGVMWLWVCGVLAQPPDESTPCVAVTKGTEVEDGMHVCVMETTDYDGLVFERDLQNVRIDGIRGTGIFANVHFLGTLQSCAIGPVELNGFQSALLFNETVMDTTIDSILGTAKSTYAIFRNDIMRCSIGKIETKLYDGGVSFDKIEDSFVGPITTYGDYSPAWFFGEIRGSQIGAIQIHETVALSDSSYLGLVYFRQEITSSVIESIWVKAGSPNPTVIFGMNASISNSSVGDISVDGGNVSAPASIAFLNSSISKSRIGNLCTSGSGTSYIFFCEGANFEYEAGTSTCLGKPFPLGSDVQTGTVTNASKMTCNPPGKQTVMPSTFPSVSASPASPPTTGPPTTQTVESSPMVSSSVSTVTYPLVGSMNQTDASRGPGSPESGEGRLSGGGIAGIVVGTLLALLIVAGVVYYVVIRSSRDQGTGVDRGNSAREASTGATDGLGVPEEARERETNESGHFNAVPAPTETETPSELGVTLPF